MQVFVCSFLLYKTLSIKKSRVHLLFSFVFFLHVVHSYAQETVVPEIIRKIPHDSKAFTQGLIVDEGIFYESTGLDGNSSLRTYNTHSEKMIKKISLEDKFFAEGLTLFNGRLYQLTWKSGVMFVYDKTTFKIIKILSYNGEGWGLTSNNKYLAVSYTHLTLPTIPGV